MRVHSGYCWKVFFSNHYKYDLEKKIRVVEDVHTSTPKGPKPIILSWMEALHSPALSVPKDCIGPSVKRRPSAQRFSV
jgi:hypothetical protein